MNKLNKHQTQILKDFFNSYRKCTKNGFLDIALFDKSGSTDASGHLFNIMQDIRVILKRQEKEEQKERKI